MQRRGKGSKPIHSSGFCVKHHLTRQHIVRGFEDELIVPLRRVRELFYSSVTAWFRGFCKAWMSLLNSARYYWRRSYSLRLKELSVTLNTGAGIPKYPSTIFCVSQNEDCTVADCASTGCLCSHTLLFWKDLHLKNCKAGTIAPSYRFRYIYVRQVLARCIGFWILMPKTHVFWHQPGYIVAECYAARWVLF